MNKPFLDRVVSLFFWLVKFPPIVILLSGFAITFMNAVVTLFLYGFFIILPLGIFIVFWTFAVELPRTPNPIEPTLEELSLKRQDELNANEKYVR